MVVFNVKNTTFNFVLFHEVVELAHSQKANEKNKVYCNKSLVICSNPEL